MVSWPFSDYYAAINFGAVGAISASFLARDNGYWAAYLLPTCIFLLVPGVLWFGRKNYIHTPPRGSVLVDCARVIKMASRGKWSLNPVRTYRNFKAADFWEPAKHCQSPSCVVVSSILIVSSDLYRRRSSEETFVGRRVRLRGVQDRQGLRSAHLVPRLLALLLAD